MAIAPSDTRPVQPRSDRRSLLRAAAAAAPLLALHGLASAQSGRPEFTPQVGQSGKDVIWVPTPDTLVHRMLQLAQVTPNDLVVDLGSGDGKIVIAAARDFGARSLGVEFNPDMVALSRRNAERAGVGARTSFQQGDIFATDFTSATVVTMYLLPGLNLKLRPQLLRMRPGTRLVTHAFTMGSWEPDDVSVVESRTGNLWIVPANAGGEWRMSWNDGKGNGEATVEINQVFQNIIGTARFGKIDTRLRMPRLRGDRVVFELLDERAVLRVYEGRVAGNRIEGTTRTTDGVTGTFSATRQGAAPPVDAGRE